jgi:hypothetical protein
MQLDSFFSFFVKGGRVEGTFTTSKEIDVINNPDRKPFDLTLIVGDKQITFYIPSKNGYGDGGIFRNALLLISSVDNSARLHWTPAYMSLGEGFQVDLKFNKKNSGTFVLEITNMERFGSWKHELGKSKGIRKSNYDK